MKRLRAALWVIVPLGLIVGGVFYWRGQPEAATPTVITAEVQRGTVEQTVLANGMLKPARLVAVGAQASGRITSVNVALGQEVQEGDLIAQIDSVTQMNALRTTQAQLANTKAQLKEKEANLALAERTLDRQKTMLARKAAAQTDFDSAESQVEVMRAQIEALHAQIEQGEVAIETAQANVAYTRITAPIAGTVLAIVSQEGQTVNANQAAPTIAVLGQLDRMTVRAEISEADIVNIHPGQNVWFTILGEPNQRYEAKLDTVEPAPESIRNDSSINTASTSSTNSATAIYYNGVFTVPNPDLRLRTYMTAQVNIVLGRAENVLTIPASALGGKDRSGSYRVRVQGADGQVESRQVSVGLNDKVTAEITQGLSEGERVVTGEAGASRSGMAGGGGGMRRGPGPMGF